MDVSQALEKLLPAFRQYYTINTDSPVQQFLAEAEFRSHNEQYFLVRSAHIADIDSNEFVYFAGVPVLDDGTLMQLVSKAWATGLEKVRPHEGHRNSDITLIILADKITEQTQTTIKKTKLYKSYKFSFHGWSHFKLTVADMSSLDDKGIPALYCNRQGKDFAKLIKKNIKNPS
jgi:hypothetical protein